MKPLAAALLLLTSTAALADQPPPFSSGGLSGWTPEKILNQKQTFYAAAQDGDNQVVLAQCADSASMLGWAGSIDLGKTPVLQWRWKVQQIYPGLDERVKGGSDFPARIYVVVGKKWMPWAMKTLEYAWSNGEYQAASWPSPYSGVMGQAVIVPVRSGGQGVGEWQEQRRDVQADFKQFFGLDIDKIGAVALMSDCDDAHGKGQAWYGDLHFLPRQAP
jgi:hypothetical protein